MAANAHFPESTAYFIPRHHKRPERNKLLQTNILISVILVIGFFMTVFFSSRANYRTSIHNIEEISALAMETIYSQMATLLAKPVSIALTMANDSFLVNYLNSDTQKVDQELFSKTITAYLDGYYKKYLFPSFFLISTDTGSYYTQHGKDRVMSPDNQEDSWYYSFLQSNDIYELNVDNDEVLTANNEVTLFVNAKVYTSNYSVIGIVGMGLRLSYIKSLLEKYKSEHHLNIYLIDDNGKVLISTAPAGYENKKICSVLGIDHEVRDDILCWKSSTEAYETWTNSVRNSSQSLYLVGRYIPDISLHLLVVQDTDIVDDVIETHIIRTSSLLALLLLIIIYIVTMLIRKFNGQITELITEREAAFKRATEKLYEVIHEINVTGNCCADKNTEEHFASMGATGLPYDRSLALIAEKCVREDFRPQYLATFSRENVIQSYGAGINHLACIFPFALDGKHFEWMRVDAHIFLSRADKSIHMFVYKKNIDEDVRKEKLANMDEMTGCLTKTATERAIVQELAGKNHRGKDCCFFIMDIDNFKQANDTYGHAFGDFCIRKFASILKAHFRENDIIGRVGGDEFVAFIPVGAAGWLEGKAAELSQALHVICEDNGVRWEMSASIGACFAPVDCVNFASLYKCADVALYETKRRGKNGFTIAHWDADGPHADGAEELASGAAAQ